MREFSEVKQHANAAVEAGRYEVALHNYTELLAREPTNVAIYLNRSLTLARLGLCENAALDAKRAMELSETPAQRVKAQYRLACALHTSGKNADACKVIERALQESPGNQQLCTLMQLCSSAAEEQEPVVVTSSSNGMRITSRRKCTPRRAVPVQETPVASVPQSHEAAPGCLTGFGRLLRVLTSHVRALATQWVLPWLPHWMRPLPFWPGWASLSTTHVPAASATAPAAAAPAAEPAAATLLPSQLAESLPSDVLLAILAPLDPLTIVRCKCVCRAWATECQRAVDSERRTRLIEGTFVFTAGWFDSAPTAIWPEADTEMFSEAGTLTLTATATPPGFSARGLCAPPSTAGARLPSTGWLVAKGRVEGDRQLSGGWHPRGHLLLEWVDCGRQSVQRADPLPNPPDRLVFRLSLESAHLSAVEMGPWAFTGTWVSARVLGEGRACIEMRLLYGSSL
jgi:hypothetical protein